MDDLLTTQEVFADEIKKENKDRKGISLKPEILLILDATAEKEHRNRSNMIEIMILEYCKKLKQETKEHLITNE